MNKKILPLSEEKYYELMSFLVSSAYLLGQGEAHEEGYPSMRLMDFARRLTQSIIDSGGLEGEDWPQKFLNKYEEGENLLGTDVEAYYEHLSCILRLMTEEMIRQEAKQK
jgi:hypothetical protein